jgi:hypothetical protein
VTSEATARTTLSARAVRAWARSESFMVIVR